MAENGIKIPDAQGVASAQNEDLLPAARGGQSIKLSVAQIAEQAGIAEGFLKGDPSGVYVENQSNNDKWQLDQRAAQLFFGDGDDVVPNVEKNDRFVLQVNAGGAVLRPPTNVPGTNTGMFYFQIHAFTAVDDSLTFGAGMIELPGSKPYDNSTDMNIIECWTTVGGATYYRVDNALLAPGETLVAEGVITSAQILSSNTTPVALILAPGAGKIIQVDSLSVLSGPGTLYATNVSARIGHSTDLGDSSAGVSLDISTRTCFMNSKLDIQNVANIINNSLLFFTDDGDPTTGTFDIFYSIKYRIIDNPFA